MKMLVGWAKTKKGQKEADILLKEFSRNGAKGINADNFIELGYDYLTYNLCKKHYKGYFSKDQQDILFKILDYYPGRIISIN